MLGAVEEQSVLEPDLLEAVLIEMHDDASDHPAEEAPRPRPERDNLPAAHALAEARTREDRAERPQGVAPDGGLAEAQIAAIEQAFSDRDRAMKELRRDMDALRPSAAYQTGDDVSERLAAIDARLDQQEQSLRQVMASLIEILETSGRREAA